MIYLRLLILERWFRTRQRTANSIRLDGARDIDEAVRYAIKQRWLDDEISQLNWHIQQERLRRYT